MKKVSDMVAQSVLEYYTGDDAQTVDDVLEDLRRMGKPSSETQVRRIIATGTSNGIYKRVLIRRRNSRGALIPKLAFVFIPQNPPKRVGKKKRGVQAHPKPAVT